MWCSDPPEGQPTRLPSREQLVRKPLPTTTLEGVSVVGVPESVPEFDTRLVRALRESGAPGMVLAVARDNQPILVRGYGTLTSGGSQAVEPTLPTMLCSLCKPLTAQMFLLLAEEGKLALDDSARQWLPQLDSRITLRHLLMHRSGLAGKFQEGTQAATEAEHVLQALTEPLAFTPGEQFLYSNVGYQVLGRVLAALTRQRPDRLIQARLLDPLGIRSYFVATYLSAADQVRFDSGSAYIFSPNRYNSTSGRYAPVRDRVQSLSRESWGSADTCGAGCMSAIDLLHFLCSVTPAQRTRIVQRARDSYGLGWMLRDGGLAHTGIGSGETHYVLSRSNGLNFVCFINSSHDAACASLLATVQAVTARLKPHETLTWQQF